MEIPEHDCKQGPEHGCSCSPYFIKEMPVTQVHKNASALADFHETYPDVEKAFKDDPAGAISYLRLLGYRCAACGANAITVPIIEFHKFGPRARCWGCQTDNKYED